MPPRRAAVTVLVVALAALATGAQAASLQDLADRLIGRSRSQVRSGAVTEMRRLPPADQAALVPLLLPGLARPDPYERMNAAYALGLLDAHARPAADRLVPLLQDPSEMVRQQARATRGRLGQDRAAAVAAEIAEYRRLQGAQDIETQVARRSAIARLGYVLAAEGERPAEGVAALGEALTDPYAYARHAAANALFNVARLSCADVLPTLGGLLRALREADRNTAFLALATLEAMGVARVDPEHRRAAQSETPAERRALGERLTRELTTGSAPPACPASRAARPAPRA